MNDLYHFNGLTIIPDHKKDGKKKKKEITMASYDRLNILKNLLFAASAASELDIVFYICPQTSVL